MGRRRTSRKILGSTYEVAGLAKAPIRISEAGIDSAVEIEGVGRAQGRSLRSPVTDEPHEAHISLPDGFIRTDGNCGVGSISASAEGLGLEFGLSESDGSRHPALCDGPKNRHPPFCRDRADRGM